METEAMFEPIKAGGSTFRLKCKAKGFAKRIIRNTYEDTPEDGRQKRKEYDDDIVVKKISYKIKDAFDNTLDEFKIEVEGMQSQSELYWESNAFIRLANDKRDARAMDLNAYKKRVATGGIPEDHPTHVMTKGGGDPGLALIMGHFVSTELTPARIAGGYSPDWRHIAGYDSDYSDGF
eukprot:1196357-Prorocentrum_minimum.AAC.4